jgi:hypothetical protein
MISKNIQSPRQWTDLWLTKLSAECAKRNLAEKEAHRFCSVLDAFLTKNPGNPRQIPLEKLEQFVKNKKKDTIPPLILFYQAIAFSSQHIDLLTRLAQPSLAVKKTKRAKKK